MEQLNIVFLGICERAAYLQEHDAVPGRWNILGLRNILFSYIFPFPLNGCLLGFALPADIFGQLVEIEIVDDSNRKIANIHMSFQKRPQDATAQGNGDSSSKMRSGTITMNAIGHTILFEALQDDSVYIPRPGAYYLKKKVGSEYETIGQVEFVAVDPPALTPERITALRSEPKAVKPNFRSAR